MADGARMTVEVFPAGVGDSILIRCASEGRSTNILVDGGVRATYEKHLAKRLGELRSEGQRLNLLVVTHIDTDHIGGVVKLLKANGPAATPSVIEIDDVWHNGYRHLGLSGRKPNETEKRKVLSQVYGSEGAGLPGDISVQEADTLAKLLGQGAYPWNKAWGGGAVVSGKRCSLDGGVSLAVLSPGPDNLRSLGYQWRKGLPEDGSQLRSLGCP